MNAIEVPDHLRVLGDEAEPLRGRLEEALASLHWTRLETCEGTAFVLCRACRRVPLHPVDKAPDDGITYVITKARKVWP